MDAGPVAKYDEAATGQALTDPAAPILGQPLELGKYRANMDTGDLFVEGDV